MSCAVFNEGKRDEFEVGMSLKGELYFRPSNLVNPHNKKLSFITTINLSDFRLIFYYFICNEFLHEGKDDIRIDLIERLKLSSASEISEFDHFAIEESKECGFKCKLHENEKMEMEMWISNMREDNILDMENRLDSSIYYIPKKSFVDFLKYIYEKILFLDSVESKKIACMVNSTRFCFEKRPSRIEMPISGKELEMASNGQW